jgi:hypothetical protein
MRKGKGKEAKLSYCLNALMENRNGLLMDFKLAAATGTAERETALRDAGSKPARLQTNNPWR